MHDSIGLLRHSNDFPFFFRFSFSSLFILKIECAEFDNSDRYVLVWVSEQSGFTEDIKTFGNPYRYICTQIFTPSLISLKLTNLVCFSITSFVPIQIDEVKKNRRRETILQVLGTWKWECVKEKSHIFRCSLFLK